MSLSEKISDVFSNYTTAPRMVIRSRRLRIPELIISSFLVVFTIMYLQVYKLKCFARTTIQPSPLIAVMPPLLELDCEERFMDCVHVPIDADDVEKHPHCLGNSTLNVSGCMPVFGKYTQGNWDKFVPTMGSRMTQERDSFATPWRTTSVERKYVAGIEVMNVVIAHAFKTLSWKRSEMVGILRFHNGTECQLPCERHSQDGMHIDCSLPTLAPSCHYEGVRSKPWADYIPLKLIMDAADLDLNALSKHYLHTAPLRYWGSSLVMDISYDDDSYRDFWFAGGTIGPVPKFVVAPRTLSNDASNQYYEAYEPSLLEDENNQLTRVISKNTGLLVLTAAGGQRISFEPMFIITSIVVALGTLKVARLLVDSVLVNVYSSIPGWEHTALLYQYYTQKFTPSERRLAEILADGESPEHRVRLLELELTGGGQQHLQGSDSDSDTA
eukprot:TRINITY_DN114156_c0_g1_i1.p1 TRINITY_DN114156_c0_g1~~TRINITY_DN114156_c0_g1_i1.p1  ORF type:complete len:441 (-),score=36.88 TRINITY_DN114156_c0_g1_i1:73-1395(-)